MIDIPVILTAGFLFVSSCTYSPSGTNFMDVNQEPASLSMDFNISPQLEVDETIKLFGQPIAEYQFTSDFNDMRPVDLEISLGSQILEQNRFWMGKISQKKHFAIDTYGFPNGIYNLNIKAVSNSGTGSIADLTGNEIIEISGSWKIEIDNLGPTSPDISAVVADNRQLLITWNPYLRPNFSSYYISKNKFNESTGQYQEVYRVANQSITDRYKTSLYDPVYIGGEALYRVVTIPEAQNPYLNNHDFYGLGKIFTYNDEFPVFQAHVITDSQLELRWSICKYPDNFGSYLVRKYQDDSDVINFWSFTNIEDTSLIDTDFTPDSGYHYELITMPKLFSPSASTYDTIIP